MGGQPETLTIEEVVARIPEWRGQPLVVRPLAGGMTNASYRVEVAGLPFVVRIPGASTELLAVDRRNEHHNARVAAGAGIGPRVTHYLPDAQVMVVEFVRGRPLTSADLRGPGMPARLAATLRALHAGPPFLRDFDMFRLADYYVELAGARGIPLPPGCRRRLVTVHGIEAALRARPAPVVPCHNDLVADNVIDDGGERLRLVDWEYSGNNDPAFELGNACRELGYGEGQSAELCRAYYGAASPGRLARMRLHAVTSDVGWALWAAIQVTISRIEYDFAAYGACRWARAEAALDSPDLAAWLGAAAGEETP